MRQQRRHTQRSYPRVARINELLREILADALERIDDDRTQLATVTGVVCEGDLRRATVFFDGPDGADGDAELGEVLAELRPRLQGAIARQARLKHTPELHFVPDPAIRAGEHIDDVLRDLGPLPDAGDESLEGDDVAGLGPATDVAAGPGGGEDVDPDDA